MYQTGGFSKKVTIAKVDATNNDIPVEIAGFPTIKLYPAGAKDSPVDYVGDRSIADLADFIRDHGKHGIDVNADAAKNASGADDGIAGEAAAAASKADDTKAQVTDKAKSVVSEAAEAVKTAMADSDDDAHDEL